jgi:hypothetical protein
VQQQVGDHPAIIREFAPRVRVIKTSSSRTGSFLPGLRYPGEATVIATSRLDSEGRSVGRAAL